MKHKDRIIELHNNGFTYLQIQQELGCAKSTIAYHCGDGQKGKNLKRQQDKRKEISSYIQNLKESSGCVDCKTQYPYYVMEFDHLRDKEFQVGDFTKHTQSLDKIKLEIEKCDIVCANCHRARTYMRLQGDKSA